MSSSIRYLALIPLVLMADVTSPSLARAATPVSTPVSMTASSSCGTGSGFCFSPASAEITVGAPVTWTNTTGVPHTATADGGAFDTSIVNPGQGSTITFSAPGSYPYHCSIHPDMHGTILVKSVYTAASTQQYSLANSDGTTWHDLDTTNLSVSLTPGADATALISGNADLWTATAGYNQDIAIDVNGTIAAWKESGGFAGTFSPNAAFVQTVLPLIAGTTYAVKLKWKANKPAPGATIYAGAGPIATAYSPTRLTVQLVPPSWSIASLVSTQQYGLTNSNGSTWVDLDSTNLIESFTPSVSGVAVLGGNADLWTETAGFNQDLAITVNGTVVAWKESGGFAGTFSPNAAFVQAVLPMNAGTTYTAKLQWKTNKASGATIHSGAGPIAGQFSPTRLTLQFVPAGAGLTDRMSTQQYTLTNSNGAAWTDLDATNLSFSTTPSANGLAILSGNADLFTANQGFNQDVAIDVNGTVVAWKESGGFAGTFSPNAAYVQTVFPVMAGISYTIKLRWKANVSASGVTIYAGAGPIGSQFSPTRLTILLIAG
jgi:plastocyanin